MMTELNGKKVEALKEKLAAAIKMLSEEYTGARQKLITAQQLYPELDNISLMLTICDILLLASSFRLSNNHKTDFSYILDLIYPSSTYSDATNYFNNLVELINGFIDEFPGAELALEIVQNGLSMLSKREKEFCHGFRHDDNGLISSNEILDGEKNRESASTSENYIDIIKADVPLEQSSLKESMVEDQECPQLCVGQLQSEGKLLESRISAYDFSSGQVWAIYCGKDEMPRQYAVVNSVVSNRQVCVTLLEPELDYENKWKEDLPVACGTFKHGNINVILDMSRFSHLVKYMKVTTKPQYKIYPQKGEIWAIYKNWKRKWKHDDYEQSQCWLVEIISDFSEENGIKVAKLEEVHNCLTFFHRQQHQGSDLTNTVFKAEMLRFSHQILAYKVPGIEKYGIPKDSWHLEPDAIPYQQNAIPDADLPTALLSALYLY